MHRLALLSVFLVAVPSSATSHNYGRSAPSLSAPSFDAAAFEQTIATANYSDAAKILDALIEERDPADGEPRPDSLLNALIGRFLLAAHQEAFAVSYLDRVDVGAIPASMRGTTLLAHGKALESLGQRERALSAYRAAANAEASSADSRNEARISAARQLLVSDPLAARQQLLPLAMSGNAAERWQARHLLAVATSLAGDPATAAGLADQAWADAAKADAADLAPLKVATVRAGLAALANDRQTELAMLASANSMTVTRTAELTGQLPVCGKDDVRKSDFVVFGIVVGPYNTNALTPIAASRAAVVKTFYDRLAGRQLINQSSEDSSANGTVVTLACRSIVAREYVSNAPATDPLLGWFVERGLYPASVKINTSDEAINQMSRRVDALAERFGRNSPLLLQPKWQVLTALEARAAAGDNITPGRLLDLRNELAAGLRREGAPEWFAQTLELRNELQTVVQSGGGPEVIAANLQKQYLIAPFWLARSLVRTVLSNTTGEMPLPLARAVTQLAQQAPAAMPTQESHSWKLTLAAAYRALGDTEQARAAIRDAGLASNACAAADEEPKLLEQPFSHEDYPTELIPADLNGHSFVEFEVTASGHIQEPRFVVSMPSGLFDAATTKGLSGIRYQPATRVGKDISCTGALQCITWRLQTPEQFGVPPFVPIPADETI